MHAPASALKGIVSPYGYCESRDKRDSMGGGASYPERDQPSGALLRAERDLAFKKEHLRE